MPFPAFICFNCHQINSKDNSMLTSRSNLLNAVCYMLIEEVTSVVSTFGYVPLQRYVRNSFSISIYLRKMRAKRRCLEKAIITNDKHQTKHGDPVNNSNRPLRDQAAINRKTAQKKKDELRRLKERIAFLEQQNESLNKNRLIAEDNYSKLLLRQGEDYSWAADLKSKGFPPVRKETNMDALMALVATALLALMNVLMAFTKPIKRLRVLCKVLFEQCVFGEEETRSVLTSVVRKYVRSEVFVPWKVLKAMDLAPKGSLNYQGLEILRGVEGLDKWEQGSLPARSTVQKQGRKMYEVGQQIIPIKAVDCDLGEMFMFEYEPKLRLILKTFGLETVAASSSIELAITLDGAELCDNLSHLTAGVKVVDKRAIDPRTKRPLCTFTGMFTLKIENGYVLAKYWN